MLGFACSSTFLGSGLARDPGTLHPSRPRGLGSPRAFDQKHHLTTSPIGTYCPHHTQGILLVLASEISTTARSRRFLATLVFDTQLSLLARSATTPAHPCRSRTPSTCRFEANTTICSLGVDPLPYIEYVTLSSFTSTPAYIRLQSRSLHRPLCSRRKKADQRLLLRLRHLTP
jgi:hypothetical protein